MGLNDIFKKIGGNQNNPEPYDGGYDEDYYNEFDGYDQSGQQPDDDAQGQGAQSAAPGYGAGGFVPGTGAAYGGGVTLSGAAIEIKVVKPERFESGAMIADHLLNKRTVYLNLESTNKETARRLIDFLTGVAYSIKGDVRNVSNNCYIIAPSNVDVSNEVLRGDRRRKQQQEEEPEQTGEYGDFNA